MPWHHGDTNLQGDFPNNFDEGEVDCMSEFLVPLQPSPRHLLYVCRLTMTCRYPELRYDIKDRDMNVQSGSEATLSATPLYQASPEVGKKPAAVTALEIAKDTPRDRKVIIDLSGNTHASTPPIEVNQPSSPREHDDTHDSHNLNAHSQSSLHDHEDESVAIRYVSDWELPNDLRVCTFRSCKELGELLKRHEQLNHDNVDLQNHNDAQLEELDCLRVEDLERERDEWRNTASDQVKKIRSLEKDLEPRTQQLVAAEEKVGVLKGEKIDLLGKVARAKADRKKLVREVLPAVVKRLHISVEYQKSLVALAKYRELFTMSYPYVQKVVDSCDLSMNELLAVYPDVPSPPVTERLTFGAVVDDAAQQPPASALKIYTDVPFGFTT
nr:hypothetical protein [Tanacetum cinerariifolium]